MLKSRRFTIAIISSLLIIAAMRFGAYLPFKKSQLYIKATIDFQTGKIRSLQDFRAAFGSALNFYSPVGQDESISYYLGILANVVNQETNEEAVKILLKESEALAEQILKKGKGFGYSQNLYNFAMLYKMASQKLNSEFYYQKSVDFFKEGLKSSPNRYIFLAGLFDLYGMKGDKAGMKEMGEIILKYWPNNEVAKQILGTF
ncbi:MAG: hypothetical protein AAB404_01255 [Patescibacteria group bacterium]